MLHRKTEKKVDTVYDMMVYYWDLSRRTENGLTNRQIWVYGSNCIKKLSYIQEYYQIGVW